MFFSYNNGISTTASEIEVKDVDGTLYITRLYDWQIVNGGQTTASIAACLHDKEVELSKVFVPMKVSVIRDVENSDEIVKAISTSANSQTAIKNSDFSANEPYLIDLEKYSRTEWVPNGNSKPVCNGILNVHVDNILISWLNSVVSTKSLLNGNILKIKRLLRRI